MAQKIDQMIMHDIGLRGTFHIPYWVTMTVQRSAPIGAILTSVSTCAQRYGRFRRILIAAHGIEGPGRRGGYGIELGRDNLVIDNIQEWAKIRGKVALIEIHCCKVAAQSPVDIFGRGDGMELCSKLAGYSGATVLAGDADQIFVNYGDHSVPGRWQGQIYKFAPNGTRVSYAAYDTSHAPIEEDLR